MRAEEARMEGRALKCVVMVIEIILSCGLGLWPLYIKTFYRMMGHQESSRISFHHNAISILLVKDPTL